MHDSLGHALVVVNVKLEAAQRLYAVDVPRGGSELEGIRALVRETMAELRRSLANLRAALPDHHDLSAALQRMADEIRARTALRSAAPRHPT
jgi:signal transduction histidine kinase